MNSQWLIARAYKRSSRATGIFIRGVSTWERNRSSLVRVTPKELVSTVLRLLLFHPLSLSLFLPYVSPLASRFSSFSLSYPPRPHRRSREFYEFLMRRGCSTPPWRTPRVIFLAVCVCSRIRRSFLRHVQDRQAIFTSLSLSLSLFTLTPLASPRCNRLE